MSLILSQTEAVGKYSFADKRQPYSNESPPPKYFSNDLLLNFGLSNKKDEILKGLIIPPQGGLICVDQEAMERQKGVLAEVLKQLTVNLLKGLTISHISMPIKIFEPRSAISRIVDIYSFAPKHLKMAAAITDNLERFKLVIAFALSGVYICTS